MMRNLVALILALSLCCVSPANAHTRSQSFSSWEVQGDTVSFVFAVDMRRVTQLAQLYDQAEDLSALLTTHLAETMRAVQGAETCIVDQLAPLGQGRSTLRVSGRFICPQAIDSQKISVTIAAFHVVSPTHIHIVRVNYEGGSSDQVLREGRATFTLQAGGPPQDFLGFVSAGFAHVLSGLDHLVFLVALLLVVRTLRSALFCITGFTLGHTLALGLATFGVIDPNERLVEALIGFTIAVTALEAGARHGLDRKTAMLAFAGLALLVALVPIGGSSLVGIGLLLAVYVVATSRFPSSQTIALLPAITTAFGLVHGAGFSGGLKEAGLSQADIVIPLLGFNVGVELAQLLALIIILGVMLGLKHLVPMRLVLAEQLASLAVFSLGCFWFAQRLWA